MLARLYGGYFVLDLKLVIFSLLLSALLALATVLLVRRLSERSRRMWAIVLLTLIYLALTHTILTWGFDYPAFRIAQVFELP